MGGGEVIHGPPKKIPLTLKKNIVKETNGSLSGFEITFELTEMRKNSYYIRSGIIIYIYIIPAKWIRLADPFRMAQISPGGMEPGMNKNI